ncbi:TadE family type IV pilus minor pilin [Nonomuraea sp. NPDC047897]|uniref:TadE family type IV pilus minor pilin n=1 Tax=Nonomuraea sp. NPDC047897 TaxID=3364346 RepID=UPI00371AC6C0
MISRVRRFPRAAAGSPSRGSVTAETAAVLPALMAVLAAALWIVQAVGAQLECVDAARAAVRAASRGESLDRVRDLVRSATRPDAWVRVSRDHERTRVEVSVEVRPPWGGSRPSVRVAASASADTES